MLKKFKKGVLVHDASYYTAVQLEGPEVVYFIVVSASENNGLVLVALLKVVLFTGFISFSIKNGTCALSHNSSTSQKS